jgi:hypothetical protein
MSTKEQTKNTDGKVLQRIAQVLENLKYGTVEITVHNSKVVQIDRIERIRVQRDEFVDIGGDI